MRPKDKKSGDEKSGDEKLQDEEPNAQEIHVKTPSDATLEPPLGWKRGLEHQRGHQRESGGGGAGYDGDEDDADPDDLYSEPQGLKVKRYEVRESGIPLEQRADDTGEAQVPAAFDYNSDTSGVYGEFPASSHRGSGQQSTQAPSSPAKNDEAGSQHRVSSSQSDEQTGYQEIADEHLPQILAADSRAMTGSNEESTSPVRPAEDTSSSVPSFNTGSTNAPEDKSPVIEKAPIESSTNGEEWASKETPPEDRNNTSNTHRKNTDTHQPTKPLDIEEQSGISESQQKEVRLEDDHTESVQEEHNGGGDVSSSRPAASAYKKKQNLRVRRRREQIKAKESKEEEEQGAIAKQEEAEERQDAGDQAIKLNAHATALSEDSAYLQNPTPTQNGDDEKVEDKLPESEYNSTVDATNKGIPVVDVSKRCLEKRFEGKTTKEYMDIEAN